VTGDDDIIRGAFVLFATGTRMNRRRSPILGLLLEEPTTIVQIRAESGEMGTLLSIHATSERINVMGADQPLLDALKRRCPAAEVDLGGPAHAINRRASRRNANRGTGRTGRLIRLRTVTLCEARERFRLRVERGERLHLARLAAALAGALRCAA